jgi:hypothetical protein
MAYYYGPAQLLHLALLDSDFWSRPSHPLPTCHVNNFLHSLPSLMSKLYCMIQSV